LFVVCVGLDANTDDPRDSPLVNIAPSHLSTDSEG